uniref:Uncharacterized protein n=1 Tax=Eutreptiella gymnastica TaxID=73025 RepID=A0A7S4FGI4_9EUGL
MGFCKAPKQNKLQETHDLISSPIDLDCPHCSGNSNRSNHRKMTSGQLPATRLSSSPLQSSIHKHQLRQSPFLGRLAAQQLESAGDNRSSWPSDVLRLCTSDWRPLTMAP